MTETREEQSVVESIYAAFEAGDVPRMRALLADDLRWRQAARAVPAAGEDVSGAEALIDRVVRPLQDEWDGFSEAIEHMITGPGWVVATGTYQGTYRATGREVNAEFCHVWRVRDGQAHEFRQYTDTAAFAAAVG